LEKNELKRTIAQYTLKVLRWGRDHLPPGIRSAVGVLFLVGGVLGFLPILGFWMFPLGLALIALDLPSFERPAKATSAPVSGGSCDNSKALVTKRARLKEILI